MHGPRLAVSTVLLLACIAARTVVAQSVLRATLGPGPYVAGFRAVELWDRTRTLDLPEESGGGRGERPRARPLQVSIWYPAVAPASMPRMRYREYTQLTTVPGRLPDHSTRGQAVGEHLFALQFVRDTTRARRELDAVTAAVRGAPPAQGSFPIVVYAPSRDGMSYENSPLAEYLASHGYIVLASPSWGAEGPMTPDFAGLEAQARDMEYLVAYGRTLPNADATHVAVMGDSWGGMANILVAMRDTWVNAVVTLDGSIAYWYNRRFKGEPFVNPDRLTAPALFLKQGDPFPSMTPAMRAAYGADTLFTMFGELRYTDAYLVVLETVRHQNFSALHDEFPAVDSSTNSFIADTLLSSAAYERECHYTLAFLDAYLKDSPEGAATLAQTAAALGIPSHEVTIVRRTALRPTRTVAGFARTAARRGLARASDVLAEIRVHDAGYMLPEGDVDAWGTALLMASRIAEGVGVLELNATMYPASSNAQLSLAQAYVMNGQRDRAIASYERSLALDSTNDDARRQLASHRAR